MPGIVIVGVDGSDTAFKAASRAAEMAKALGTDLTVVSAHTKDNTDIVQIGSETWILDDADKALEVASKVADQLRREHTGLSVKPLAAHGKPQDVLIGEARRADAGLLVVGNVGMKGLGRVLGSVASSVTHNAPCDVLIVRTAS